VLAAKASQRLKAALQAALRAAEQGFSKGKKFMQYQGL
jgi:hypothetical protein